jgi:thiosulfate dehydrogenase
MRKYVLVFIAGIVLVPAAFYLYLRSGYAPVSTSAHPLPFERFFARLAMHATLSHEVPKVETIPPTMVDLKAGANLYRENCAICHGLPRVQQTAISKGMYPHPPQFFRPGRSTAYDSSRPFRPVNPKAYWKVKYGVRLTGMPSFKGSFTEPQIREVSQFVSNARNLPPAVLAVLEVKPVQSAPATPTTASQQSKIMTSSHK